MLITNNMLSFINILCLSIFVFNSSCLSFSFALDVNKSHVAYFDLDAYADYEVITRVLNQISTDYPHLTSLRDAGQSINGRNLWYMKIGSGPVERPGIPKVKLVGNVHGNEAVGRQLLLYTIEELVTGHGKNSYITSLIENVDVYIMPSANPDGFERSSEGDCDGLIGRYNENQVDLNTNFPRHAPAYSDDENITDTFEADEPIKLEDPQLETKELMNWMNDIKFVLSASFHGGGRQIAAIYPWDSSSSGNLSRADDDLFHSLSSTYAQINPSMSRGTRCDASAISDGTKASEAGVVRGNELGPIAGISIYICCYNYYSY